MYALQAYASYMLSNWLIASARMLQIRQRCMTNVALRVLQSVCFAIRAMPTAGQSIAEKLVAVARANMLHACPSAEGISMLLPCHCASGAKLVV
jgi:hypothetical protein